MRAIGISDFGGRDKLQLLDLPVPRPGYGEILVRVRAAGVNPVDYKIREGLLKTRLPHLFPVVLGLDAAGTVEACGPSAKWFAKGAEIYAYCRKPIIHLGTYAEYVTIPENYASPKPPSLSFEEAATLPLAALTAWQCLFDSAQLQPGQTVLIHAAAGGVGGFAAQLARERGARVIGTAGARNLDYVRGLGAHEAIDYAAGDFREAVRQLCPEGVDVAFDTVGGDVQARSADVVRPGGTLVSILALQDERALAARGIQVKYVFVVPNSSQLTELTRRVEAGRLRTTMAAVLPLDQAAKAHELIETRHVRGKIALRTG